MNLVQEIYFLDLIGTFAFASFWSYLAMKKKFDIFWVFVCAFLTAVGWWTIREMILWNLPFYFTDLNYIYVTLFATVFSTLFFKNFDRVKNYVLILDAIWLVTFAFIWSTKAANAWLWTFGIIFFAVLTAIWWWVLRDLVLNKTPEVMHSDFYATIAILFWFIYSLCITHMQNIIWVNILILIFLMLRLFIIYYRVGLWKPNN